MLQEDKELLELAAKAAGIELQQWVESRNVYFLEPYQRHWNALTDDGDALRLAVKLRMDVEYWNYPDRCFVSANNESAEEPYGEDQYAATRRAIVRTAAEIGKGMK